MRTRVRRLPTVLTLAFSVSACRQAPPAAITVGAVSYDETQLLGLSNDRRQTLANLAAFGLAVADSSTIELGQPLLTQWTDDRLVEILAAELTLEKNGIEDAVLQAQYLTDPRWELTVRHILFFSERWRPEEHRREAREKAARAMEALQDGADFASTAASLSEEPGAEGRQGLLTPGREGSWVPEFWAAALVLQPSEISPVTETQYGFHILRLEGREVVPFPEARADIARQVADRIEDPAAVLELWKERASPEGGADEKRAASLAEARLRGLLVPESERAELLRTWEDQVYQWSATLGFRYGSSDAQVAAAALAALSNPAQGANLARADLSRYTAMLSARYPMMIETRTP
jgi:hypothetical protein